MRSAMYATVDVPGQQSVDGAVFPLVYDGAGCDDLATAIAWAGEHRDALGEQAAKHGAVLFRGFPITDVQAFDALVTAFDWPNFTYKDSLSNAVRTNLTPRVFTANEAPPDVEIFLHHEMAQTPIYPSKLFFYCDAAPDTGGQTPLCRSDALFAWMLETMPDFTEACERRGLRYTNVMPGDDDAASGQGRSWRSTFGVATKEAAEDRLSALGYTWQWREDGSLAATTPTLAAVRSLGEGDASGRRSFFNQLIAAFKGWKDSRNDPSKAIQFGDGTPMDRDAVLAVAEQADAIAFNLAWQKGDVALVDNYVAMHGRRPFTGTRRVLASLVG